MTARISSGLSARMLGQRSEMVTNGVFTTDTTGWTATSATLSSVAGGNNGNCLQVSNSSTANGKAYQDIPTLIGQTYELNLYVKRDTAATIAYYIGTTSSESSIYTSGNLIDTTWTKYTTLFKATEHTTRITVLNTTTVSGNTGLFDDISVSQVSGSLKDVFAECFIAVYDSASAYPTQPTSPDSAITDTQLLLFSDNKTGNPLKWEDLLDNGYITKIATMIPASDVVNAGTAKYYRLYRYGDSPTSASTTLPRIDGTVGDLSSSPSPDLLILSTIVGTEAQSINRLRFNLPMACGV